MPDALKYSPNTMRTTARFRQSPVDRQIDIPSSAGNEKDMTLYHKRSARMCPVKNTTTPTTPHFMEQGRNEAESSPHHKIQ